VKRRRHSWLERWLFVQAVTNLVLARLALRIAPFRVLVRVLGMRAGSSADTYLPGQRDRAELIGWAVRAASTRLPWHSTCLTEALAAAALLRSHGLPGTLSVGVGRGESRGDGMLVHAWLQCGDLVLTGAHERGRFAELTSFALP
jgi:hypothetical protein